MEELVYDIVSGFDDEKKDIDFILTADEARDFLTAFLYTGEFKPVSIEWAVPDISGYDKEYCLSLCQFNGSEIFLSPVYNGDKFVDIGNDSIILASAGIKLDTYNRFAEKYSNVILFDIED